MTPHVGWASQPVRVIDGQSAESTLQATTTTPNSGVDCDPSADDEHPQLVGRTRCDRIVVFDGNPRLMGSLTHVHIYDCTPTTLIGSIVTREFQHGGSTMLPILA